jgi:hypothetical protein
VLAGNCVKVLYALFGRADTELGRETSRRGDLNHPCLHLIFSVKKPGETVRGGRIR